MKKFFLNLLILTIFLSLIVLLSDYSGQVNILWKEWIIETSMSVLIGIIILFIIINLILGRFINYLSNKKKDFYYTKKDKKIEKGLNAISSGFSAIYKGDLKTAKKELEKAEASLGSNDVVKLMHKQIKIFNDND